MAEIRAILVPLDGSELAARALPYAESLARALHARLVLVRVTPSLEHVVARTAATDPSGGAVFVDMTPLWEKDRAEARAYLEAAAAELRGRGIDADARHAEGDAAAEIQRLARELPADLVVMSTRGQGGLKRLVLGSVADAVVRGAVAPVLLLPAKPD
ncbi:MAG TPA: universal stress protein [Candidatus Limnocylindrales bacterium]|nr:universal stress protein [Candidatus Limnocylindrales bacterium]